MLGGTGVPLSAAVVELEVVGSEVVEVVDGDTAVVVVVVVGSDVDGWEVDGSEVVWLGAGDVPGVVVDGEVVVSVVVSVVVGGVVLGAGAAGTAEAPLGRSAAGTEGRTGMLPGPIVRISARTVARYVLEWL